jgi:LysM repeat protein
LAEDAVQQYTVKKGDSCASIARRFYGDSRYADLLHEANNIHGPQPHRLQEGRVLVIPPKPPSLNGPDAKLTSVYNRVEVQAPDTRPGRVNDPLFRGNRVSTEAVSAASVTFRDETQVHLGERTLVVILGDTSSATPKSAAETTLVTGNLRAWMAKSKSASSAPVAITTKSARVRMEGVAGEAQVSADATQTTRLSVYSGNSKITAARKTESVAAGFGSKAELGKPPERPKPLPYPPVWTAGSPEVLIDRGAGAPSFVAEYAIPEGASADRARVASWHVQIAHDTQFHQIVVDRVVNREVKRVEAPAPTPGRYFVRVSAINDDRFEGGFGRVIPFGVIKAEINPTPAGRHVALTLNTVPCVRVGNVALHAVNDGVDLQSDEDLFLRCAPSESEPTTLFKFPGAR